MEYKILLVLHLLGSSVWVGGHLILAITILPRALKLRDPDILNQFESRYEKIGIPALLVQVATGLRLVYYYTDNVLDVFDFAYSQHTFIALKIILLSTTIVIAAHARIRLIGKLKEENMVFLAWHIITVTILGVVILFFGAGIRIGNW